MSVYSFVPDVNLGIEKCVNGTPERNATLICGEVDYAFRYNRLPFPYELFMHLIASNDAGMVRE